MNTTNLKAKDLVAYALIAVGVVALLGRLSGGAGWLWIGLIAVAFLWAWVTQKSYGLLVTGCILAGVAVGFLLESSWGWNGAFLISLGIGFIMIDRLETRQNKWPFYVGAILAVLGLLIGILETGFLGSFWFALLLIGAGVFILTRSQGFKGSDNNAGWVKVEPQPTTPSPTTPSPSYSAVATPATTTSTTSDNFTAASSSADDAASSFVNDTSASSSSPSGVTTTPTIPVVSDTTTVTDTTLPFEYDQDLYTRLETWRRETARSEDRAAYLILTNDTMQNIATLKPQTMQELLDIKGIGEVKLERYGEALLKLIKG